MSCSVIQPDGSNIQCINSVLGSSGKLGRSTIVPNTVVYWSGVGAYQLLTVIYWSGVGAHQFLVFPPPPAPISGSAMKSLPIALKHRGAGGSQLPSTGSQYVTTLMV